MAVFFAALSPVVVFAGALDAVEAGALPAVEAGLGAIADVGVLGVNARRWKVETTRGKCELEA